MENNEIMNPESFLLQHSPVFNGDSVRETIRNQTNDLEMFGQSNMINDNVQSNLEDN